MIRFACVLVFIALTFSALGQPQIVSVDGTFVPGETVSIGGTGFGEKPVAAPFLWDDLTSGAYSYLAEGSPIPTQNGNFGHPPDSEALYLDADGPASPASTVFHQDGRIPGRAVYSVKGSSGFLNGVGGPEGDFLYLNWWMRSTNINSTPGSGAIPHKILRVWPGSSSEFGSITIYPQRIVHSTGSPTGEMTTAYTGIYPQEGIWTNIEVWTDASGGLTPGPDSKGILKVWKDGQLLYSAENLGSREGDPQLGYTWIKTLGMEATAGAALGNGENQFGDIYIDNTQARVIISDAPTWSEAESSHNEIQIPQKWSATQIDFLVNAGSFLPVEEVYLFIVDSEGNVNPNGFPIEISNSNSDQVPGKPGQPTLGEHEPGGGSSKK